MTNAPHSPHAGLLADPEPLPPPDSLHVLAARNARTRPTALAIDGPGGRLSYGEFWARVSALAAELADRGARRGDRIVIWCANPLDAIVCMQSVLLLGAVYVPVADDTPLGRLLQTVNDCKASLVCTTADRLPALRAASTVTSVDCRALSGSGRRFRSHVAVRPTDTAFILYTSGSTGAPKGVMISHGNARAFVDWAVAEFDIRAADRLANHAALTFDLSVFDIYAAFAAGACVVPVPHAWRYDAPRLTEFLHRERITVWYSVPSALMLMMRLGGLTDTPPPSDLRLILFAGEPFPIGSVRRLAAWCDRPLYNLYGPTETNVCAFHRVTAADLAADAPLPIGRACSGNRLWIARPANGDTDCGELYVEGPTVFQGYWGAAPHRGPYPTGDLVRKLPDGRFVYLGRTDDMVKVRGHRIEPAEIEAAANAYPGIGASAAVAIGEGIDAQLILVIETDGSTAVRTLALRGYLAERLVPYLRPDKVIIVDHLPRTLRGKVDRAAARSLAAERLRC